MRKWSPVIGVFECVPLWPLLSCTAHTITHHHHLQRSSPPLVTWVATVVEKSPCVSRPLPSSPPSETVAFTLLSLLVLAVVSVLERVLTVMVDPLKIFWVLTNSTYLGNVSTGDPFCEHLLCLFGITLSWECQSIVGFWGCCLHIKFIIIHYKFHFD